MAWFTRILFFVAFAFPSAAPATAFCGFYVAQADGDLFNESSKVAIVRKDNKTVVTMANDYSGDLSEFAIVVPVPTVIAREQVNIATPEVLEVLDQFSAPRLAEYYDDNPCEPELEYSAFGGGGVDADLIVVTGTRRKVAYGVTVEDSYTAGEYDIVILSAERGGGLLDWLNDNGYKMPNGAERILKSYIKQDMKFFVAKVNLDRKARNDKDYLSPISIAYEDEDFMLPIRLGTLNANGSQDLIVFAISSEGRIETKNYQTRKIPTNEDLPLFIKEESAETFSEFYKALFEQQVKRAGGSGVWLEYFWDIGSCDPCAGEPPTMSDLLQLGVFWMEDYGLDDADYASFEEAWEERDEDTDYDEVKEDLEYELEDPYWGDDMFLTRLHVRYDGRSFPEDLSFQETGDDEFFQGRYVINVPWRGEAECPEANDYIKDVKSRQAKEFSTLANLTGWTRNSVKKRAIANKDWPFSLTPKISEDDAEKEQMEQFRSLYQKYYWWQGAFPHDEDTD